MKKNVSKRRYSFFANNNLQVKRMEEAIKALEENEKKLFEEGGDGKKRDEDDDLFDDDHAIKRFNLMKASNQLRKTVVKSVSL